MMTKEECLEALESIHSVTFDSDIGEYQLLKQLINEHFDNPSLKLEEVKEGMKIRIYSTIEADLNNLKIKYNKVDVSDDEFVGWLEDILFDEKCGTQLLQDLIRFTDVKTTVEDIDLEFD